MGDNTTRRGATAEEAETETSSESKSSKISRRGVLKTTAAAFVPASGITATTVSGHGLNSKGVPVVVVQSPAGENIPFQRRKEITDRVHDEAVDRGRAPPAQKGGVEGLTEQAKQDQPFVAHVNTINDDGIGRRYHGQRTEGEMTGTAHARAMGRAKMLAERNGAGIEVHKPNGKVETLRPKDVGTARRATDVPGETTGFTDALTGSNYALVDERSQRYSANLDDSLSTSSVTTSAAWEEDLGLVWEDSLDEASSKIGDMEVWSEVYHNDSGGNMDPYAVGGWFWQSAGEETQNNDWENNYGKIRHRWDKGDIPVDQLKDWLPNGDETNLESTTRSVTVSANDISFGMEDTYYKDGSEMEDKSKPLDEWAGWTFNYNTDDSKTGNARHEVASVARKESLNCSESYESIISARHEAGYKERGHSCGISCVPRDSHYMNYFLNAWC